MLPAPSNLHYTKTALFSKLIFKAMFQNAAAHTPLFLRWLVLFSSYMLL